ncbi:MAG: thiamine phosphate synthase, partial [Candidatus Binataceae bacterium]
MRPGFKLYFISDRKLAAAHGGLLAIAGAALRSAPPGTVAIQLREKDLAARELLELATALRTLCTRYNAKLLINDRIDVALASGADGVHLPADSFAVADARELVGPQRLIGVST